MEISINSGVLDLKMRRKVSLAPLDAGAGRIAPLAVGETGAVAKPKRAEAPASQTTQVSRTERVKEVLFVSIRCGMQLLALRFARELLPMAKRAISPAISRQEGRSAAALAPPVNGQGTR